MLRIELPNDDLVRTFDAKGNLIYELDYQYHSEGIVVGRHFGYQNLEETRELFMNVILERWRIRPMPKALVDYRLAISTLKADLPLWLTEEFYPSIAQAGLKYQAVVIVADPMHLGTVYFTQPASLRHFQMRIFFEAEPAMAWLRSC